MSWLQILYNPCDCSDKITTREYLKGLRVCSFKTLWKLSAFCHTTNRHCKTQLMWGLKFELKFEFCLSQFEIWKHRRLKGRYISFSRLKCRWTKLWSLKLMDKNVGIVSNSCRVTSKKHFVLASNRFWLVIEELKLVCGNWF